jgi:hypothetical protein
VNGAEVDSSIVMGPDRDVRVQVFVLKSPGRPPELFDFDSADGWSVETSGLIVIATRFDTDEEGAEPVEVRAWPWATGGVGVVEINTGPAPAQPESTLFEGDHPATELPTAHPAPES